MAKVQGKKSAAGTARRATGKVAARVKSAAHAMKKRVTAKPAGKKAARPAHKTAKPAKPVKAVKAVKAATKPAKAAAKPAKAAAKPVKAAAKPAKAAAKTVKSAAKPAKPAVKPAKPAREVKAPKLAKRAVAAPLVKPAAALSAVPKPAVVARPVSAQPEPKKRTRRPRPRVHSNGAPVANWLPPGAEKPRPSSFIPAPPRAEAPSLIAAPPASSDRLIRPEDVTDFVTRTVPIRVDVEQAGGRVFLRVNPDELAVRPGEGIEWDFRYLGGADISVDELTIEFEKPSPFSHLSFRSRKPGSARPHRQLSGAAQKTAVGKRFRYVIRAYNQFKTELAMTKPALNVVA